MYKVIDKEDKYMFEFEALINSIKKKLGKHKDVNLMPSKFLFQFYCIVK